MRRINLQEGLEREIDKLDAEVMEQLKAYADGFNLYLSENKKEDAPLRFDVVAVTGADTRHPEILHFENAFRPER